jgi:hypothetical protein
MAFVTTALSGEQGCESAAGGDPAQAVAATPKTKKRTEILNVVTLSNAVVDRSPLGRSSFLGFGHSGAKRRAFPLRFDQYALRRPR